MTTKAAANGLTRRFGHLLAFDDLSLTLEQGEVLGFLGPNGSGKSTAMKMVTGPGEAPASGSSSGRSRRRSVAPASPVRQWRSPGRRYSGLGCPASAFRSLTRSPRRRELRRRGSPCTPIPLMESGVHGNVPAVPWREAPPRDDPVSIEVRFGSFTGGRDNREATSPAHGRARTVDARTRELIQQGSILPGDLALPAALAARTPQIRALGVMPPIDAASGFGSAAPSPAGAGTGVSNA